MCSYWLRYWTTQPAPTLKQDILDFCFASRYHVLFPCSHVSTKSLLIALHSGFSILPVLQQDSYFESVPMISPAKPYVDLKKNAQHENCGFKFDSGSYWGLPPGRQPLSSSEELLWRGGRGARIHMTFLGLGNTCSQACNLVKDHC